MLPSSRCEAFLGLEVAATRQHPEGAVVRVITMTGYTGFAARLSQRGGAHDLLKVYDSQFPARRRFVPRLQHTLSDSAFHTRRTKQQSSMAPH